MEASERVGGSEVGPPTSNVGRNNNVQQGVDAPSTDSPAAAISIRNHHGPTARPRSLISPTSVHPPSSTWWITIIRPVFSPDVVITDDDNVS